MEAILSCQDFVNSDQLNLVLRRCVRSEVGCGNTLDGAFQTIAAQLHVHPNTVRWRYEDRVTGPSRIRDLTYKAWRYLADLTEQKRIQIERELEENEKLRLELKLPLDGVNASDAGAIAGRVLVVASRAAGAAHRLNTRSASRAARGKRENGGR